MQYSQSGKLCLSCLALFLLAAGVQAESVTTGAPAPGPFSQNMFSNTDFTQGPYVNGQYSQLPFAQLPYSQTPLAQTPFAQLPYSQTPLTQTPMVQDPGVAGSSASTGKVHLPNWNIPNWHSINWSSLDWNTTNWNSTSPINIDFNTVKVNSVQWNNSPQPAEPAPTPVPNSNGALKSPIIGAITGGVVAGAGTEPPAPDLIPNKIGMGELPSGKSTGTLETEVLWQVIGTGHTWDFKGDNLADLEDPSVKPDQAKNTTEESNASLNSENGLPKTGPKYVLVCALTDLESDIDPDTCNIITASPAATQ